MSSRIEEYPNRKLVLELMAARLFMQERWHDWRTLQEKSQGVCLSRNNCLVASGFLEKVLDRVECNAGWHMVKTYFSSQEPHVLLASGDERWLADITADQFDLPPVMLAEWKNVDFQIWATMSDELIMDFESEIIEDLWNEWRLLAPDYREQAEEIPVDHMENSRLIRV